MRKGEGEPGNEANIYARSVALVNYYTCSEEREDKSINNDIKIINLKIHSTSKLTSAVRDVL